MTYKNLFSLIILLFGVQFSFAQTFDLKDFDTSTNPCEDFYQYVNGGWLESTEIPETESRWGSFSEILEDNRAKIKTILETQANRTKGRNADEQMIGDLYYSGMDIKTINDLGAKPILEELAALDKIESIEDVIKTNAQFESKGLGSLFYLYVSPDSKNSKLYCANIWQGGLSLPARAYYLNEDERSAGIRAGFLEHVQKMFELAGTDSEMAAANAKAILKLETRLAQAHRTPVQNRNPEKAYNKLTIEDLKQMSFNNNWDSYFEARNMEAPEYIVVNQPEYLAMMDRLLADAAVADWKVYFKWKLITATSEFLSDDFNTENFNFYSKTLRGVQAQKKRWKRTQAIVNSFLGQPLGKIYVAQHFKPEAKERMLVMIEDLRAAFAERIKSLDWMSDATKEQALIKLAAIGVKVGYPDVWRDFTGLEIKRNDYLGNIARINEFNNSYQLARIGKAVDINDWGMSPPTVNAYYSPNRNEIVFPAGILQPPFFDFNADDAVNYGAIGAVIGHEITHGFDDSGSQFDAEGNLNMWWTPEDRARFQERADKIVTQYDGYTVLDSVGVNGRLTLGENIADLGGLTIAYNALQNSFAKNGRPKDIDGYTAEQRFFLGFARIWRGKYRDQALLQRIKTDPHSPGIHRANGTLSNMPAFYEAFNAHDCAKHKKAEGYIHIW